MKIKSLTDLLVYGALIVVSLFVLALIAASKSYFFDSNLVYGKF
jgi:hypothetical protein